jgi:hypothetical protein
LIKVENKFTPNVIQEIFSIQMAIVWKIPLEQIGKVLSQLKCFIITSLCISFQTLPRRNNEGEVRNGPGFPQQSETRRNAHYQVVRNRF